MPVPNALPLAAAAFQLAAVLDTYDQHVRVMIDTWLDMDLYSEVSDEVEQIRTLSAAFPQLGTAWVELLIAHAELVHSLWRLRFRDDDGDREKLDAVRERHANAVRSLREPCLHGLVPQDTGTGFVARDSLGVR